MIDTENDKKIKYTYSICAVVFGANESILELELNDGFRFLKKSLIFDKDELNGFFDKDFSNLQRDFYSASNGMNEIICIVKEKQVEFDSSCIEQQCDELYKKEFKSVEDQLETIRLLNEGYIRIRQFSANMEPELIEDVVWHPPKINPNGMVNVPINNFSTLHINKTQINTTNEMLKEKILSKLENEIYIAHRFYDVSYSVEPAIAVTLLITALEVLFLNNEKNIKEKLSKRCSLFIETSNKEINLCYLRLKDCYKKRSEFVHEGNVLFLTETQVVFLRECVRKSILKALENKETKAERIKKLKIFVDNNQHLFEGKNANKD